MKKGFVAVSALLAYMVGLAIIAGGLGAPPSMNAWFGGIVDVIGVGTILLIWANKNRVTRARPTAITRASVSFLIAAFFFFLAYVQIYDWCIVRNSKYGVVMYPLWATGELASIIEHGGEGGTR